MSIFCGHHLLVAKLRSSNVDTAAGALSELQRIIGIIREKWKDTQILVRGDSAYAREEIFKFCEDFENAGAQTHAFVEELQKLDLLMDGEVSIQQEGLEKPYIYRGFKMVDENKLRELRGDAVRKLNQNGILALIHAHLFSLQLMREVFAVQVAQGKVPQVTELPTG